MWPLSSAIATSIGGPTARGEISNNTVVPVAGTQDSNGVLLCNVGDRITQQRTCGGLIGYQTIGFATASTLPILYDSRIVINNSISDTDTGLPSYFIGTLFPGTNMSLFLPFVPGDQFSIEGALTEGGPLEIFNSQFDQGFGDFGPSLVVVDTQVAEPNSSFLVLVGFGFLIMFRGTYRRKG